MGEKKFIEGVRVRWRVREVGAGWSWWGVVGREEGV